MREADVGSQSANTIKLIFMLRFCVQKKIAWGGGV
jgi:hypothetical protein